MSSELMNLVEEMRGYAGRLPPAHSDLAINEWADRLEDIAKAQGEPVAWMSEDCGNFEPVAPNYGRWVPLYAAPPSPAADVLVEALRAIESAPCSDARSVVVARSALAAYEKECSRELRNRRVAPDWLVSLLTAIWSDEHEPEHRRAKAAELLSVLAAATFQENDK